MRVLQINSVYKSGSTGKIVSDIACKTCDEGHESYIAYAAGRTNETNIYCMGSKIYQKINIIKTRIFGKHGFYNKNATKKLIQWIKDVKPDMIHLHNIHGHYINIKILFEYLKKINVPVVWTLHDCWAFTGHCAHFDFLGCEKWKDGCFSCENIHEYPRSWFFDRSKNVWLEKKCLFTSIDNMIIVTPSKWLANLVKQSFLNRYEVQVIYNGVNLDVFKPNNNKNLQHEMGLTNKFIVLGMANKWLKPANKNVVEYLNYNLDDDIRVVLVGCNDNSATLRLDKIITIPNIKNPAKLAEYYAIADVFVNLTLEDNFPTVNIEALSCGTPVITYNAGGSPECIIDNSNGIVIDKLNQIKLIDAIKMIENNPDKYSSKATRESVKQYFNNELQYREYINLYNRIIKK
jgi:putative colanic acid biosynthesis glycosyltransferase